MTNTCIITCNGRISKDPKKVNLNNEKTFCSFSIAVNKNFLENGTWTEKPMFFDVTTYQQNIFDYLKKGQPIIVSGELFFTKWSDNLGVEHENHNIKALFIELAPKNKNSAEDKQGEQKEVKQEKKAEARQEKQIKEKDCDSFEEELPF